MDKIQERVLLIESDAGTAALVHTELASARYGAFKIVWAETLAEGRELYKQGGFKAVLLNLWLRDSEGIETFETLYQDAYGIPIMILSDLENERSAQQTIKLGAQDYFLISQIDGYSLAHALRNVIARKVVEDALFIEQERVQVTLDSIADAVISADIDGIVTYLNLGAERMTGWRREDAVGQQLKDVLVIIDGVTHEPVRSPIEMAMNENIAVGLSANSILRKRNGNEVHIEDSAAPIHDRSGKVSGAVMVFHDVSEARAMVLKMSHMAQHDYLTDLPNRLLLNDRLMQAIAFADRHQSKLAVLFLDLDLFKNINDSLGHIIGDKLLQSVADRLRVCVRASDTVCRQGGDEFVILLSDLQEFKDASDRAEMIMTTMADYHRIEGHELNINMSIGISVYPNDGNDAETLIKNADAAMYQAKNIGRNNYQFFRQDLNDMAVERHTIEADLRRALANQELCMHYQPIVNLESGAISGTEALLRWQHPTRGILLPDVFIPIAEECNLIVEVGQWVLHAACTQLRHWLDAGYLPGPMSINISPAEFRDKDFISGLRDIIEETYLEPDNLELEVTESILMRDVKSTKATLKILKSMGLRLAIDDFGTGYSSLSYLKRFPIDTLKIDQTFVRDIAIDQDDATIVSAVIGMGNSLNKQVCAEGIETRQQLDFLRKKHCSTGQGFYFSPAVDAQAYTRILAGRLAKPAMRFKHKANDINLSTIEP